MNEDDIHKSESFLDSTIINLILDHFNMQSLSGKKESLSGSDFQKICDIAESMYYRDVFGRERAGIT